MKTISKQFTSKIFVTGVVSALIFICLIFFILITQSCAPKSKDELQVNYDQIGIDHNKGLDYVFNYLKKSKAEKTSKMKREETFDLAEKAVIEYTSNVSYAGNEKEKQEMKVLVHNEFWKASGQGKNKDAENKKDLPDDVLSKMTDNQKVIMNEVFAVINDLRMDLKPSLEKLTYIENRAKSICKGEELPMLLSAIAVGKHSLQYWHDNLGKWKVEFGSIDRALAMNGARTMEEGWYHWKSTAGADVAGAVGGVVYGWIAGPLTWGVVLAGAAAGSTADAVKQVWDHYIY